MQVYARMFLRGGIQVHDGDLAIGRLLDQIDVSVEGRRPNGSSKNSSTPRIVPEGSTVWWKTASFCSRELDIAKVGRDILPRAAAYFAILSLHIPLSDELPRPEPL
jgi:hypothetical protein